jgi:succinoglycan biosynthesis protein ExoL
MSAAMLEQGPLKVLFMLSILNDARDSKRIAMLQQAGFKVEAVAFDRGFNSGRAPSCPVEILGNILNGHYVQRIPKLVSSLGRIRRSISRNDIVYTSGIDMALTALIGGMGLDKPVITEVGDIRKIQVSHGFTGRAVRLLDQYVGMHSNLIVATAPGFIHGYYHGWLNVHTPAIVIENKLEASVASFKSRNAPPQGIPLIDRALRIGYFGMLRCDWSWQVLEELAASAPDRIQIMAAGHVITPSDIPYRAAKFKNIEFRGEFRSPEHLAELYGDVDLIWACYPSPNGGDKDWQWAQAICRSNRFYESCFFQKPIISQACSADAIEIAAYDIGLVLSGYDTKETVEALLGIDPRDLEEWKENLSRIQHNVYTLTSETQDLAIAIAEHVVGKKSTKAGGSKAVRKLSQTILADK